MRVESAKFDADFYFCHEILRTMNLQSILNPIVEALQWSFKYILEPMTHWFNWVCIAGGFIGVYIWLRMQKKFSEKAQREGTTI